MKRILNNLTVVDKITYFLCCIYTIAAIYTGPLLSGIMMSIYIFFLCFQASEDRKTQMIYSFPSIIMIIIGIIEYIIIRPSLTATEYIIYAITLSFIIFATALKGMGLGDTLIYMSMPLFFSCNIPVMSAELFFGVLFLSTFLFICVNIGKAIKQKTLKIKSQKYTTEIFISSFIMTIFGFIFRFIILM